MIIEEQDLFIFVFFPDKIGQEKKQMILHDASLKEAMEFYEHLKLNSYTSPTTEIKRKLTAKIPAYKLADIIEFHPIKDSQPAGQNGSRMAASTKALNPKASTKTFIDDDKEYIIKVLNSEDETKVFVFSTKDEIVKNFDLIIEPQKLTYHLEDNSAPLIIPHHVDAEKIQLKFS
jgi:hypothetical protein